MSEHDPHAPIPVLLIGQGADHIVAGLSAGLAAAGKASNFSCAAFPDAASAARASSGAPHLILVGLGASADGILEDLAWGEWEEPGSAMARIAMSDDLGVWVNVRG